MGVPRPPQPVIPLVGILGRWPWPDPLSACLQQILGEERLRSPVSNFTASRYYEREMGPDLHRGLVAFAPGDPGALVDWKLATQTLEERWRREGGRWVNLDPGYVNLQGLFLASTKPGVHRVYLRDGVYGEITLRRVRRSWQPLPWTFPEFRHPTHHPFLDACRAELRRALRTGPETQPGSC